MLDMDLVKNPFLTPEEKRAALAPRTEAQGLRRRLGVIGVGALIALGVAGGVKAGVDAAMDDEEPRPTHSVIVKPGDPSPVWRAAGPYAQEQGVDRRDVVSDIEGQSSDLRDGFANPGDVMVVPMTDAEIAKQEAQDNQG